MLKLIIVLLLVLPLAFGCDKENVDTGKNTYTLGIDVQASFDQDHVVVSVDQDEKINKTLETNHLLGVCNDGRLLTTVSEGTHSVTVVVNNTTRTETFIARKDLYMGINFDRTANAVSINYSDEPFGYD